MSKSHYFLKLLPCRPTFAQDMTPDERAVMMKHIEYMTSLMNEGTLLIFGPVMDPAGAYGVGIVAVDDEEQVKTIVANDPASSINTYEYYPMRAVVPAK